MIVSEKNGKEITLKPFLDRVVIKRVSEDMIGSLYVPDHVKDGSVVGEILHAGPDCQFVQVGDKVLFGRYSGTEKGVPFGDKYKDAKIMNEADLLCLVEEKED